MLVSDHTYLAIESMMPSAEPGPCIDVQTARCRQDAVSRFIDSRLSPTLRYTSLSPAPPAEGSSEKGKTSAATVF